MPMPFPVADKSTTVRAHYPSPPPLKGLGRLERIAPRVALEVAEFLFFRPGKRLAALDVGDATAVFDVAVGTTRMRVGRWGQGPAVIGAHGWAGGGRQFEALRRSIVEAGHAFVSFDLPGHGATARSSTHVGEFAEALLAVSRSLPEVHAVVGHSLGATATCIALKRGLHTNGVVLIAPMPSVRFALDGFASLVGVSASLRERLESRAVRRAGLEPRETNLESLVPAAQPALFIHDRNDRMVPIAHTRALAERWPGAASLETTGRGHNRVLADASVAEEVSRFLVRLPRRPSTPLDRQLAALDAISF